MHIYRIIILFSFLACTLHTQGQTVRLSLVPELSFTDLNDYFPKEKHPDFGGFSGIEYDFVAHKWYIISDGRPPLRTSYVYQFSSTISGFPNWTKPDTIFAFDGLEGAESISITADRKNWIIASEGDDDEKMATGDIHIADFNNRKVVSSHSIITRYPANRGLESVASDNNNTIWTISEWPSFEDKDFIRVRGFKLGDDTLSAQFYYPIDIASCLQPEQKPGVSLGNGVSEMVMENDSIFWVVERCFDGRRTQIKLNRMRFPDVSQTNEAARPAKVELLNSVELNSLMETLPDNIEGAVFGPTLPDGSKSICLIADDNFSRFKNGQQKSVFIVLRLESNN